MKQKKDVLPYYVAGVLLLLGIVCYGAFSAEPPKEPVRQMFTCVAGKVLFTHKTHTAESGYGIACADCHHHPEDAEESLACGECHKLPEDGSAPESCEDCHEPDDFEIADMIKQADALHGQCIGCHKENGAGPEECASCHVKHSF